MSQISTKCVSVHVSANVVLFSQARTPLPVVKSNGLPMLVNGVDKISRGLSPLL